ncbi:MAG: diguanylate cyclase [Abyssibacter sp.]|nr:diguanylate cyclase [Abyssibacter sp.]MCK5859490.1 diguanylate cyclase [Abyssibacter sp.]
MPWFRTTAIVMALALFAAVTLMLGQLRQLHLQREMVAAASIELAASRFSEALASGEFAKISASTAALVSGQGSPILRAQVIDIRGRELAVASRATLPLPSWLPARWGAAAQGQVIDWFGAERRVRLVSNGTGLGYLTVASPDTVWWPPGDGALRPAYIRALVALVVSCAAMLWLLLAAAAPPIRGRRPVSGAPRPVRTPEQATLDGAQRRMGRWFELMGYAVVVTDPKFRVRWMNAQASRLTGWSHDDALQQLVYSVFCVDTDNSEFEMTPAEQALREQHDIAPQSMGIIDRQGFSHTVSAGAARLTRGNSVIGSLLFFKDTARLAATHSTLEHELKQSRAILARLADGVITLSGAGSVVYANAHAARLFGYTEAEMPGVSLSKLLPVPFLNAPDTRLDDYVGGDDGQRPKVVGWRKDATTFPVHLIVNRLPADGEARYLLTLRDRSHEASEVNLSQRLGRLFDSAGEEVYLFDAQTLYFLDANRGALDMLGYDRERLLRMTPLDLAPELEEAEFHDRLAQLRAGGLESVTYQTDHRRADGGSYPVEITLSYSQREQPPVFLAIAEEITARREAEARLEFIAHHDVLTELPNRLLFMDRLEQGMHRSDRTGRLLALVFVDLDLFKRVNDTLGHEVGDGLLKAVGQRLLEGVRMTDTVARLAGDEFTLLLNGVVDRADVERIASKLLQLFEAPFQIDQHEITIGISMGISIYPMDHVDSQSLLRHADEAMYAVKRAGRGNYRIYDAEITPDAQRTLHIDQVLRNAIALDELQIVARPVVHTESRRLGAVHVRVEWSPPDIGPVDQTALYEAAQRTGVLEQLELRVLRGACELYQSLPDTERQGEWPFLVALSTWQLRRRDFAIKVADLLTRYDMPGHRLVLGLEEGGLLDVLEGATAGFTVLRDNGVEFDILEFGAGYQRLGRMAQCPIRFATIPAAVVRTLGQADSQATLKTLVATANGLGAQVIAAGVGQSQSMDSLARAGVDYVAGPAVARPVGVEAFAEMVRSTR